MSPEELDAYASRVVATAPPLSAAQAATIRGILLSGLDADRPDERGPRGRPRPRAKGGAVAASEAPPSSVEIEGSNASTVPDASDTLRARRSPRARRAA
jgi:hypothetical protein